MLPTPKLRDAYVKYFGMILKQDEWWHPKYVCGVCYVNLYQCVNYVHKRMPFCRSMIWSEPHHPDDCYFVQQVQLALGTKKEWNVKVKYNIQMLNQSRNLSQAMIHLVNHSESPSDVLRQEILDALPPPSLNDDSIPLSTCNKRMAPLHRWFYIKFESRPSP